MNAAAREQHETLLRAARSDSATLRRQVQSAPAIMYSRIAISTAGAAPKPLARPPRRSYCRHGHPRRGCRLERSRASPPRPV